MPPPPTGQRQRLLSNEKQFIWGSGGSYLGPIGFFWRGSGTGLDGLSSPTHLVKEEPMKTLKYLVVAAAAVPALAGPGFAQTPKPATPPAATAEDHAKAGA